MKNNKGKKRYKSFEELANAKNIEKSQQYFRDSQKEKVRIWGVQYNPEKRFGFFYKSDKYDEKIFVHKSILSKSNIDTKLLNQNAIFEASVERTEKGLQAKDLVYVDMRVPCDTYKVIKEGQSENFALTINRFSKFQEKKFIFPKDLSDEACKSFAKILTGPVLKRYLTAFNYLPLKIETLPPIHPEWRLIIGLGTDSVHETGITLHHIYGFPYIPGQTVKGALRSFVINEFFERKEKKNDGGAFGDRLFCDIFGCPKDSVYNEARQGQIWFFDAFPINAPEIEVDIMNPHYGDYYKSIKPPADYLDPTPIPFLTVGKNTKFQFVIGVKKEFQKVLRDYEGENSKLIPQLLHSENSLGLSEKSTLLEVVRTLLGTALKEQGVGAKTAVGYGYFKE